MYNLIYPAVHEKEKNICELELEKSICSYLQKPYLLSTCWYKKINTFDDGNQKYENDPNEWFQIGHDLNHPEKIILVNKITNKIIYSISN